METPVDKELLFNYFAGRATPLQKKRIEEWVQQPGQEEQFYQWLDEWENQQPQYAAEMAGSLENYRQFMNHTVPRPARPVLPGHNAGRIWAWPRLAAASVVLLIGLGLWLLREPLRYRQYTSAYGETRSLELPDGSRVTLNANTTLSVPRFGFGWRSREVRLAGEAVFSVVHTRDHTPFRVVTDNHLAVRVLGTEFSVFARPRGTRVVLTRGKVQVQHTAGRQTVRTLTMKPGEVASLTAKGQLTVTTTPVPENHTAWARKQFVFDNTSLREITSMLLENYGLRVKIEDARLAGQTVSGSFTAGNAEELLQALADILELDLVRQADHVLLAHPAH
jgi:ferric-dicitrate binding protein FerR (iron transport regulator)